jgi:hypothetical protein
MAFALRGAPCGDDPDSILVELRHDNHDQVAFRDMPVTRNLASDQE